MDALLEKYLWDNISYVGDRPYFSPYDIIKKMIEYKMINSPKQAWRTLEKWTDKGIYNYGSRLDLGWKEKPRVDL